MGQRPRRDRETEEEEGGISPWQRNRDGLTGGGRREKLRRGRKKGDKKTVHGQELDSGKGVSCH